MVKLQNQRNKSHFSALTLFSKLLIFVITLSSAGCTGEDESQSNNLPTTLRVGVLPDQKKETLIERYTPLLEHLSSELDINYELIFSDDYEDLMDSFITNKVDLAYFGGVTFVKAKHEAGAVPLVMRDIDTRFTSYFFSHYSHPGKTLEDFKGKPFSFGSKLSTSGHFMPRYYLNRKDINPEMYFSAIRYSGAHDKTAFFVRDGLAELGAANSKIIDKMIEDKRLDENDLKIIWETPPYPDYVWAVQNSLTGIARHKLQEAFLSLNPANEQHNKILTAMDSGGFLPASDNDFVDLYELVHPDTTQN